MEIEQVKKLIEATDETHNKFIEKARVAERYYLIQNDILKTKSPGSERQATGESPLRVADNRIPHNWHGLLVDQKAAYMLTYPPLFDVGQKASNEMIKETLGDSWPKEAKTLCVNASNCGRAWLHVWKDRNKEFQYANVDPKQIRAIYSNDLKKSLIAVIREYKASDEDGKEITVYEYWDDEACYAFKSEKGISAVNSLQPFNVFTKKDLDTGLRDQVSVYKHDFGEVPFIEFPNNDFKTSDLDKVKKLIDVYDKVYSGYVNDIEDIQEIIMILTNYGGEDLDKFLSELKRYKAIDLQNDGPDDKSGLTPMTIDIPVEARNKLLEITRKSIFVQGQGVDPERQDFGNASGVALKFVYSLLELKTGLTETEFRIGFGKLVRLICKHHNKLIKSITQTWTRNMITNDLETAQIAKDSQGIASDKTVRTNHPWVEDVEAEESQIELENQKKVNKGLPYDKVGGTNAEE